MMKASVKKQKDGKIRMTVEVEPQLVEERYREVLRGFQRQARLPGFREGKAPLDLVEKKYAKEAEEEMLKSLIPEVYHRTIREKSMSPVTLPSISDIKLERGKKLSFAAEFEEAPEVPIKNYKGIRLKRASAEVTEAELEKAYGDLLDAHADLLDVEGRSVIEEGDFVLADVEPWEKGAYAARRKDVLLHVDKGGDDDFLQKVIGASIGDSREITRPAKDGDAQAQDGRVPYVRVHLRAIKRKQLPARDDAFAKRFGKETLQELTDALRKELSAHKQAESMRQMKAELYQKLLTLVSVTAPAGVVDRQRERLEAQVRREAERAGLGPQAIEVQIARAKDATLAEAERQVKLYFILQKISELEDITADEAELERRLEALSRDSQRPVDEVRSVFEDDLRESMREAKTVDFLIAHAQFDEKE